MEKEEDIKKSKNPLTNPRVSATRSDPGIFFVDQPIKNIDQPYIFSREYVHFSLS